MTKTHIKILTIFLTLILLYSCRQSNVDGIIIGSALIENQDYSANKTLCDIIKRTLDKEQQGLIDLTEFWCGGASGCYDLGYVLTQIINKIGENEFIKMTKGLSKNKKNEIEGFIAAGLEYGDNDYDGKADNKLIGQVYPDLEKVLAE
jgi:hypothetical protein